MSAMFDLGGRLVLLTGGAGILGREMARGLVGNGGRVALVDRNREAVEALAAELGEAARGYVCDIADAAAVEALQQRIEQELGPVEVLVNNAATKSANFFAPFERFPLDEWDEVMAVNVRAAVICCQRFGGAMAERGSGSIVNTLSIYGVVAPDQRIYEGSEYNGAPINTPEVYSTSKAALWGLTRYLAAYWGERGVRVNAITPGGARSGQNDTFVERYSARVPLGRMAAPGDMAGAVCFLASDAASYVTGHNLVVDGGLTVW
jgi:NAD(P)-dependent dehydrogenase (short-subunit alcohol dehydrogenase family)